MVTKMFSHVCGVGRDRGFLRPHPTTAGPSSNPYAYTRVNYYLTLVALPAGYKFNPSRARPGHGALQFPKERGFFPLPSSNRFPKGEWTFSLSF